MYRLLRCVLMACVAGCGFAVQAEPLKIVHAGVLLATPGESPLTGVSLVIDGDRVLSIEPGYLDASPIEGREFDLIDLSDRYVLPGLIDAHVHLTLDGFPGDFSRVSDADFAMVAAANARKTVEAGITTVRDLGAFRAESIFAVRDAIDSGRIPGPRIVAVGQSISATAGHGDLRGLRIDIAGLMLSSAVCDGADDCRRAVRNQYKLGADAIKVHATGGGADPNGKRDSAPEMFDDELVAVVETAHQLGLKVAAHAHGTAGIKAALAAGVDSVEHSSWLDDDAIGTYIRAGTYLVPTAYLQDFFLARENIPEAVQAERRTNVAIIHPKLSEAMQRGVRIAMGTDAGIMPHGQNVREIIKYVELGMSPLEAIQSATVTAAELLDLSGEVGVLTPGSYADLIALSADPLADISALEQIDLVMKSGELVARPNR